MSKLNCNWRKLKFCKKKDLYDVCFQLFCDQYSLYGKKYWQQIISEELNINRKFLYENSATIFNNLNIGNKKLSKITKRISDTIFIRKI